MARREPGTHRNVSRALFIALQVLVSIPLALLHEQLGRWITWGWSGLAALVGAIVLLLFLRWLARRLAAALGFDDESGQG
ncbi:MAG: hypothetical protein IT463_04230 [Planctomycetes bacterium]|nr:hypothetical protein [Planctomycetota bacterium]